MTTLLFLLSLLANDCRVHRENYTKECGVVYYNGTYHVPDSCGNDSHYIDTCKMRCDTVQCPTWGRYPVFKGDVFFEKDGSTYVIRCYPDTAESDSGLITWFGVAPLPPPDSYLPRSYPAPLDSAELADLREMLPDLKEIVREWREKRAKDSINTAEHAVHQTCPKCGKCKPRDSGWIECTAMWCTDGCCNGCTYTFFCANTDDEFTVTINECDWIVWDTTNGKEK